MTPAALITALSYARLGLRRFQLALLLVLSLAQATVTTAAAGSGTWGTDYMPNVPVVTSEGKTLNFYDDLIKGKIVVVSFVYTSCRDMCPLITARLALLQERLGDRVGRDIHFISISIDPERDTVDRLKDFADAFQIGPGWTFVTGTPDNINLIRYKLGERSRALSEHRNDVMLGNDATGQWARDSAFSDLVVLTNNVLNMDPAWRNASHAIESAGTVGQEMPGQTLFVKTCGSCHTIGQGKRVGPDLSGLLERRTRAWVERYIAEPERVRGEQDSIAVALMQEYKFIRMPNLSMSKDDIADLMSYLDAHSKPAATGPQPAAADAGVAPHRH